MSIKVTLPTAFIRHTDGRKHFASAAENLPGLLADIDTTFPALATQIKDDDGKLRRFINIYVNEEDIRFLGGETYAFQDGDEVMLIPSIAGGSR
jgi:sulfur-carrier protein